MSLNSPAKQPPIEHVIDPHPEYPKLAIQEPTLRHITCYCGTRLTIAKTLGTRKECLCGAIHEVTPVGDLTARRRR
jgi:hypothetical protein